MATAAVLALLDDNTRKAAFESSLARLKSAKVLDVDALDICVRLLPSKEAVDSDGRSSAQSGVGLSALEELWSRVLERLVDEHASPDRLYKIAETCLSHGSFAAQDLNTRVNQGLSRFAQEISPENIAAARAYLTFLKCSFWLPKGSHHMVNHQSLGLVAFFLSIDGLEETAHDTLSAFFSLLRAEKELSSNGPLVDQSLRHQINALDIKSFTSRSSKIFRTWFQWISQAASDGLTFDCVNDEQYWKKIRLGLVHGHADQRKYCLGILRQSFIVTENRIDTPSMQYGADDRDREKYDLYTTLYETIVLHRYTGQVEDCLPSLTGLLGSDNKKTPSKITPAMATTLLTAALDPLIQESIRKTIGRWYMGFVIKYHGDISGHINFLFERFLPWATEGSLFTSTLTTMRSKTECPHGATLAAVIARFASDTADKPSFVPSVFVNILEVGVNNDNGQAVTLGVVRFIMNAGGRLFNPAISYLLDGLIQGLKARSEKTQTQSNLTSSEIDEILKLARLTGLAEVASDLHSMQCRQLCDLVAPGLGSLKLPTNESLRARCHKLEQPVDQIALPRDSDNDDLSSLQSCLDRMRESKHRSIQGPAFAPTCESLVKLLDQTKVTNIDPNDLHAVLAALWEEAEIRDFIRPFAVHLPPLLFHPTCVQVCVESSQEPKSDSGNDLVQLLSKAMRRLHKLSKGRSYVLAVLARSLRKAAFANPSIISILPFDDFTLDFVNDPASIRPEFLFEVAAAHKLQQLLPHRSYTSYYGLREWHAYTAIIDLLRRFPKEQLSTAQSILSRLVDPWKNQQPPVAVKSPWKKTFQLQAMLILGEYCIVESDADTYLNSLTHALTLESWPRYRYLLEWILARIYRRFPGKSFRIIDELGNLEDYSPIHIASLMKLGLLIASYESEDFGIKLMTQLNTYSASPKVQIRHEANYAFPLIFDLAIAKSWDSVTGNPAFFALNAFIRRLDKFNASPWTIRTLKLDIEQDFNLGGIFQGRYLSIETPEEELVSHGDFEMLTNDDTFTDTKPPPARIQTGEGPADGTTIATPAVLVQSPAPSTHYQVAPTTLQTKAGIDLDNLHPSSGPPSAQNQRPASVMMIASLIDNPTNLGGLSRISESFGLEALYIDDLKKVAHKDFKATSVRSEKHLAIQELKEVNVPAFLLEAKSKGYEVVGIEQTDRSGILGEEKKTGIGGVGDASDIRSQDIGTLPKKCCLVLGSEKEGISAEVLAVIDRNVEIKTVGVTRSLNVQTAGGIALYEWWREWGNKA